MKLSGMWIGAFVGGLALVPTVQAQTADVQVIHNSPDPGAAVVDIYLDAGATPAYEDLAFREATPILALPAGVEIGIGIAPGSSTGPSDIIATFTFTLAAGERYIVMAAGVLDPTSFPDNPDGIGTAFNLYPKAGLRTMGTGGNVDLIAFHGAPDAPTVDILAVGVGSLFSSLAFTGYAPDYVAVPPDSYVLQVTPAGEPGTVVASYVADVSGLGGGAAVAFASGFLTEGEANTFGLFVALTDGSVIELEPQATPVAETSWGAVKELYR